MRKKKFSRSSDNKIDSSFFNVKWCFKIGTVISIFHNILLLEYNNVQGPTRENPNTGLEAPWWCFALAIAISRGLRFVSAPRLPPTPPNPQPRRGRNGGARVLHGRGRRQPPPQRLRGRAVRLHPPPHRRPRVLDPPLLRKIWSAPSPHSTSRGGQIRLAVRLAFRNCAFLIGPFVFFLCLRWLSTRAWSTSSTPTSTSASLRLDCGELPSCVLLFLWSMRI